jgi:hypothetical protein
MRCELGQLALRFSGARFVSNRGTREGKPALK